MNDLEDTLEYQETPKATKSEVALTDLPHPFLKRIAQNVYNVTEPDEEQLETTKMTLVWLAHLEWPGDFQVRFSQATDIEQAKRALFYICEPIKAGSPITPSELRQGVINTAPRN